MSTTEFHEIASIIVNCCKIAVSQFKLVQKKKPSMSDNIFEKLLINKLLFMK